MFLVPCTASDLAAQGGHDGKRSRHHDQGSFNDTTSRTLQGGFWPRFNACGQCDDSRSHVSPRGVAKAWQHQLLTQLVGERILQWFAHDGLSVFECVLACRCKSGTRRIKLNGICNVERHESHVLFTQHCCTQIAQALPHPTVLSRPMRTHTHWLKSERKRVDRSTLHMCHVPP